MATLRLRFIVGTVDRSPPYRRGPKAYNPLKMSPSGLPNRKLRATHGPCRAVSNPLKGKSTSCVYKPQNGPTPYPVNHYRARPDQCKEAPAALFSSMAGAQPPNVTRTRWGTQQTLAARRMPSRSATPFSPCNEDSVAGSSAIEDLKPHDSLPAQETGAEGDSTSRSHPQPPLKSKT